MSDTAFDVGTIRVSSKTLGINGAASAAGKQLVADRTDKVKKAYLDEQQQKAWDPVPTWKRRQVEIEQLLSSKAKEQAAAAAAVSKALAGGSAAAEELKRLDEVRREIDALKGETVDLASRIAGEGRRQLEAERQRTGMTTDAIRQETAALEASKRAELNGRLRAVLGDLEDEARTALEVGPDLRRRLIDAMLAAPAVREVLVEWYEVESKSGGMIAAAREMGLELGRAC